MAEKKADITAAPNQAFEAARKAWFENYGSAVVEKTRYFLLAFIALVVIIAQGVAIYSLLPLKTVTPYVIEVEKATGRVEAANAVAQVYEPGQPEQQYFVGQFVTKLLTIDRATTRKFLSDAYGMTRGAAVDQFTTWLAKDRPIELLTKDPTLTRTVEIKSVNPLPNSAFLVRVQTSTRQMGGTAPVIKNNALTVHFALVQPKTDKEILENPIGFFVTHFSINEDVS